MPVPAWFCPTGWLPSRSLQYEFLQHHRRKAPRIWVRVSDQDGAVVALIPTHVWRQKTSVECKEPKRGSPRFIDRVVAVFLPAPRPTPESTLRNFHPPHPRSIVVRAPHGWHDARLPSRFRGKAQAADRESASKRSAGAYTQRDRIHDRRERTSD